ncbi:hypothetical protein DdX_18486 [Ditylenchus destructor]|uniref:Uncharacterized protein n=1 Tax=Ditylenchus destructor TaxID=166010 RepID=A0AAD4QUV0_9BILA|nr:hypothetical protein DdX_18486 [Ditylenchus destructor]
MKEATLKAALEECQRLSTSQLSFANKTIILHLDPVPSEHTHNDYISGNGQMPRDLKGYSQPNANLGTEIVKEEFVTEECYCPAAIKKEQNGDGDVITPIVDANPDQKKRRANANHQSILELRKQLRRAKNPQRYVENIAHCPEYQCGDSLLFSGPATDANANFGQCLTRMNQGNVRNCIAEENDEVAPIGHF